MLQSSIYNHVFRRNGNCYLYNSQHGFFAEIPENVFIGLVDRDFSVIEDDVIELFKSKGILIESENKYNYYQEEKIRFLQRSYDNEHLGLVIVPYTGCNFDCPYCFESKRNPKMMESGFSENIVSFIRSHTSVKDIALTWYGGEPLLAINRIAEIYDAISAIPDIKISGNTLITNGYCITPEVMEILKKINLNQIQVTIDGDKNSHNKTRFLKKDGSETFDIICDNIKKLASELSECLISVRINVSHKNKDEYSRVSKMFSSMRLKNIVCYPGFIRIETRDGCSMCCESITGQDKYRFNLHIKKHGCDINIFPKITEKGCMINRLYSYIIGPVGEIYKCWNDVSNEEKIIGNIADKKIANNRLFYSYINDSSLFGDVECKDCKLFPICDGGCGFYRYKNVFENGKFNLCHLCYGNDCMLEDVLLSTLPNEQSKLSD